MNSTAFRVMGNQDSAFIQKIPDENYRSTKRSSIFQSVDKKALDLSNVPFYKKTKKQMDDIVPLLKSNFLTKNLDED
jgi:hypothetical protein